MKYKIAIIIIVGIIITLAIYIFTTKKNELTILALGDGLSTGMTSFNVNSYNYNDYLCEFYIEKGQKVNLLNNFNEVEETSKSLLQKIINNEISINGKYKIKQAIKKSDIITLAIGLDELNYYYFKNNLKPDKINNYISNVENILKELRKINNKKIYLIGLYGNTNFKSINSNLKKLAKKYNIIYLDIYSITNKKEFFQTNRTYYINYKGHKYIFNKIKNKLELSTMSIY